MWPQFDYNNLPNLWVSHCGLQLCLALLFALMLKIFMKLAICMFCFSGECGLQQNYAAMVIALPSELKNLDSSERTSASCNESLRSAIFKVRSALSYFPTFFPAALHDFSLQLKYLLNHLTHSTTKHIKSNKNKNYKWKTNKREIKETLVASQEALYLMSWDDTISTQGSMK